MTDRSDRPLIGITVGRHTDSRGRVYDQLPESYAIAIAAAGGAPVLIPPIPDTAALDRVFGSLDGMLFPGGGDVHPRYYGAELAGSISPDEQLDEAEIKLAGWIVECEVPTLGICRGQQLLNIALGGTLHQDLPGEGFPHPQSDAAIRDDFAHPIAVEEGTRLAAIFGETVFRVNSFHHQAIRQLAPSLKAVGWAPDGIIEAVESTDHPWLLAVQFHPENLVPAHAPSRRLFEAFVAACADRQPVAVGALAHG
jgi:putative glutamine amidotransferase